MTLVCITTPSDPYSGTVKWHRHERMIICRDHLQQLAPDATLPFVELPADRILFWGYKCLMCGVEPVPGRLCENENCQQPLHPEWPAVYCCNACALEDVR
jgi:hypothetical protein